MLWYESVIDYLEYGEVYSHKSLIEILKILKPTVADNTYHWALSALIHNGKLTKIGYDSYVLSTGETKNIYTPMYSSSSLQLIKLVSEKYPNIKFTVFETVLMNDYLNHLIAQNTIFLQAEKDCSIFVFRFLQDIGYTNIMYKPNKNDFELYWTKDCIIITDLISEAPLRKEEPHSIMIEKMLVDMYADKLIELTYSKAEFPDICEQVQNLYCIDKVRMARYARRRNRQKEIMEYLEGSLTGNVITR